MTIPAHEVKALIASADLVAQFASDGWDPRKEGSLHKARCPFHPDNSPSCAIYPDGRYHCFVCGADGDVVQYLRETRKCNFLEAMALLGAAPRLSEPRKVDARRKWVPILPVPARAPKCTWQHRSKDFGPPEAVWIARTADGQGIYWAEVRYLMLDEKGQLKINDRGKAKKASLTWCWARDAEGTEQWVQTRPEQHIPLFNLENITKRVDAVVVLCEGPKKALAVDQFLPDHVGAAWCGGADAVKPGRQDLSPLAGRRVILWPDHDKAGAKAMIAMAANLRAVGAQVLGVVLVGDERPQAWDIADADPETAALLIEHPRSDVDIALQEALASYPGEVKGGGTKPSAPAPQATATPFEDDEDADDSTDEPPSPPAGKIVPPPGDDDDIERSDVANASRFVAMHQHRARFCAIYNRWHVWTGKVWEHDQSGAIMRLAEETVRQLAREFLAEAASLRTTATEISKEEPIRADQLRKRASTIAKKAEQVQSRKKLIDLVELAKSRAEISIKPEELDAQAYLLNCNNGVVDLRDGRLYKHEPGRLMTRLCPVDYDPQADTSVLDKVLAHLLRGDAETIAYVQKVLGATIVGNNRFEQFFIWQGPGGSGKGTLWEAIKATLGTYAMTSEFQSFTKVQGHRVRDDLARLAEARLVIASEVEKGEQLAASVLKSVVGNDTITARHLYGTHFEFRPNFTLHLQCNDLPRVDDQDSGIWRRLVVIPCGPLIPDDQRDPAIKEALMDPARGGKALLAWMVAGAIAIRSVKRIEQPAAVVDAGATYRKGNDPSKEFFAECLRFALPEHAEDTLVMVRDLIKAYHAWAASMHLADKFRLSPRSLADRLEARGCYRKKERVGVNKKPESCWIGVTVDDAEVKVYTRFTPREDEHEQALARVPVFLCSPSDAKSPTARGRAGAGAGAHTHARAHVDTLPLVEITGTQEQRNKPSGEEPLDLSALPDDGAPFP